MWLHVLLIVACMSCRAAEVDDPPSASAESGGESVSEEIEQARYLELARVVAPELAATAEQCFADEYTACKAREWDGYVAFRRGTWGNGVAGGWSRTVSVYRTGEEPELRLEYWMGGNDGAYVTRIRFEESGNDRERLLARSEQTSLVRGSEHPRWGLAQLFVRTVGEPRRRVGHGFHAFGPLYEAGAFTAMPLECERGLVPATLIRHAPPVTGFESSDFSDELPFRADEDNDWVRIAGFECEGQDVQVGPHRLRLFPMAGRNSGTVVAIHRGGSGASWRGQWVLETRNAVLGTTIDWFGAQHGWIFGRTRAHHGGGGYWNAASLFAIRAEDGVAVRLDVPPAYVSGHGGEELYFALMDREEQVNDCVSARLRNAEDEDQYVAAQGECDASIPQVDAVELTSTTLRVQQTATQWTTIPLNSLMQVLDDV